MDQIASLTRRLQLLESREAIRELAARYCWGADHRDLAVWESVWAPGATWTVSPTLTFTGAAQIRAAVQRQWSMASRMQHATANHRITIEGETATGVADVVVMTQLGSELGEDAGAWVSGGGTYLDAYVQLDGGWYLSSREATDSFLHGPARTFTPSRPTGRHDGDG